MERGKYSIGNVLVLFLLVSVSFPRCAGSDGVVARKMGAAAINADSKVDESPDLQNAVRLEDSRTILFLKNDTLVPTENGSFSSDPSAVISGGYSLMGSYYGTGSYTSYLHTDYRYLPLEPLQTYQVTFDYRILETPDKGFEAILFSPTAGQQNIWLPGWVIKGEKGDAGRAEFTNTLADFADYQVRWNIIGTGAISIDNIRIRNINTGDDVVVLDIEATSGTINVNRGTIAAKVANRPTIPVFFAWTGPGPVTRYDAADTPYALMWTTYGVPGDMESTHADVPMMDSYLMQEDHDTLYLVETRWHYWYEGIHTLSPDSDFYLDELFKSHIGTEYPDTLVINFEHPRWPQVMAEKAVSFRRAGFDGLILDWWNNGAGNGRLDQDVQAARLAIIKEMRRRVGDAFILMGNVNFNIDDPTSEYLSGVFMELWKPVPGRPYVLTYEEENGDVWGPSIERFEDALLYWDSALQWPKVIAFEPWKITTGDFIADRFTPENGRYARLFAAMACVIPENGYILYADNNDDWNGGDHQHAYYDFYRTDLGKPASRRIEVAEGVAYREYEHGIIAYNRTDSEFNLVLSSGLQLRIGPLEGLFVKSKP